MDYPVDSVVDYIKETVRNRSKNRCEKCDRKLRKTGNGLARRSLHHRWMQREGGRDSVVCLVNLCLECHRDIHKNEEQAREDGWIVSREALHRTPFLGHQGWVLLDTEGGYQILDFAVGRATRVPPPSRSVKRPQRRSRPYAVVS